MPETGRFDQTVLEELFCLSSKPGAVLVKSNEYIVLSDITESDERPNASGVFIKATEIVKTESVLDKNVSVSVASNKNIYAKNRNGLGKVDSIIIPQVSDVLPSDNGEGCGCNHSLIQSNPLYSQVVRDNVADWRTIVPPLSTYPLNREIDPRSYLVRN